MEARAPTPFSVFPGSSSLGDAAGFAPDAATSAAEIGEVRSYDGAAHQAPLPRCEAALAAVRDALLAWSGARQGSVAHDVAGIMAKSSPAPCLVALQLEYNEQPPDSRTSEVDGIAHRAGDLCAIGTRPIKPHHLRLMRPKETGSLDGHLYVLAITAPVSWAWAAFKCQTIYAKRFHFTLLPPVADHYSAIIPILLWVCQGQIWGQRRTRVVCERAT